MYKILIGLFLSVLCLQAKCQIQFDEGSFTEVLAKAKQEKRMVFMDCYTSWCGPCKMMMPIVEEIATEYAGKLVVAKVDTASSPGTAARFGIRHIPTILFFKNGEVVEKQVGATPKTALVERIKAIL